MFDTFVLEITWNTTFESPIGCMISILRFLQRTFKVSKALGEFFASMPFLFTLGVN